MSELELPDLLKGRLERHRRPPGGHGRRTEGSQRQPPWHAGDLVSLPATAAWAVEWLILAREAERFLVVPADTNPLVGSRDWAVPNAEPTAPLVLRLGHACWVPASRLTAAHGSGELSPLMLAAARRGQEQVTRGVGLSELGAEADTEPELRAWIEDFVSPACQALMALETPAVSGRGSERWLRRVAASLVLGCLGLGFWVALLWREGRRPIFSPPTAELRLAGTDRGTPPLPIHRSGSHFQLWLVLDGTLDPRDGAVRLELRDVQGRLLWGSDPFTPLPAATHSLLLPSHLLEAPGPLSLELIRSASGKVLERRLLIVSPP